MRKNGWIIKVGELWVGDSNRSLIADRDLAHRFHYKADAQANVERWADTNQGHVSVEKYKNDNL